MKLSVFGLGYVGTATCGCLSRDGHDVIGVDVSRVKIDMIKRGESPVIESEMRELIAASVRAGRLRATDDVTDAVWNSDLTFVTVGTPPRPNGSIELKYVKAVCEQIGAVLRVKEDFHTIVCRSTMLPGTLRTLVIPTLEQYSGKTAGREFGVCFNPEFLREGTSVYDFDHPAKTVIGGTDARSTGLLRSLYDKLPGEMIVTAIEVAEMVKYADNTFHAVKVTFANEIGVICSRLGIDSHVVMDIFCRDTKLNLSPYYLKPGFAFGGSCLPKDVNALTYQARSLDLATPLLNSLLESNRLQIAAVVSRVLELNRKSVGVLGFSFKAGTDDLRGSPIVEVIEALLGKGCAIHLYDHNVQIARLMGANQSYIEQHIPHIAALMCDSAAEVVTSSDVIIIGNKAPEFADAVRTLPEGKIVFDLVRVLDDRVSNDSYIGLSW